MIWFDAAVMLLLTFRIILLGSKRPRLFDRTNNSSSMASDKGQQKSISVAVEEKDSLQLSEIGSRNIGIMQLHIHVIPDLNYIR
jgi:hypothetical protein